MPESLEPRSVIEAAEQAASAGDYASAEHLLREAAQLQRAAFGPLHPGLANTLNNLGIVYEIRNNPADAERCYRQAYTIAKTVLTSDDPLSATSRKNLTDFCEARGIPIDPPVAAPEAASGHANDDIARAQPRMTPEAPPKQQVVSPPQSFGRALQSCGRWVQASARSLQSYARSLMPYARSLQSHARTVQSYARTVQSYARSLPSDPRLRQWYSRAFSARSGWSAIRQYSLALQVALLGLCVLILVALVTMNPWLGADDHGGSAPPADARAVATKLETAAPTIEAVGIANPNRSLTAGANARSKTPAAATATVEFAGLCTSLSTQISRGATDWRCAPVSAPIDAGAVFFYTRVKSGADTTVQHRWYHDDRLYQAVDLEIVANQKNGYRTYSRYSIKPKSAGNWRVELRSRAGVLLREERFVVR